MKQKQIFLFILLVLPFTMAAEEIDFNDILDGIKSEGFLQTLFKHLNPLKFAEATDLDFELGADKEEIHLHNFKRIADEFEVLRQAYQACIDNVSDRLFSDLEIDNCLGKDLSYIKNDADYLKKKLYASVEIKVKEVFINDCYEFAGTEQLALASCDLLERDVLDLLWGGMDYPATTHRFIEKYCRHNGKIPYDHFTKIINDLEVMYAEQEELIEEMLGHKDLIVNQIKKDVDDRISLIQLKRQNGLVSYAPLVHKHKIEVVEKIMPKEHNVDIESLPEPMLLDGSSHMHEKGFSHGDLKSLELTQNEHLFNGPVVHIPDRKMKGNEFGKRTRRSRRHFEYPRKENMKYV